MLLTNTRKRKFPMDEQVISFSEVDAEHVSRPHDDALVIAMRVVGYNMKRILVDNKSSDDILFFNAFRHMLFKLEDLSPTHSPLWVSQRTSRSQWGLSPSRRPSKANGERDFSNNSHVPTRVVRPRTQVVIHAVEAMSKAQPLDRQLAFVRSFGFRPSAHIKTKPRANEKAQAPHQDQLNRVGTTLMRRDAACQG
ncbi:hypothetical protein CRG98_028694 [Punica granatum]|uniref:Uncharacterized protein n=1 Tax=Punica granatum TaxID=22663 RepID=A0A2I0J412_PUNGR|nr:hypothetical protein CRG98_028694 [Punica granatum]